MNLPSRTPWWHQERVKVASSYQRWGGEGFDFLPLSPLFVEFLNTHWRNTVPSPDQWLQVEREYAQEEQTLVDLRSACWCPQEEVLVLNWQQSWWELGQALSQEDWDGMLCALTLSRHWQLLWEERYGGLSAALKALQECSPSAPAPPSMARRERALLELEQWQLRLERWRGRLAAESFQQLQASLQSAWGLVGAAGAGMTSQKAGELSDLLDSLELLRGLDKQEEDHRRRCQPATIPWVGYSLECALEDGYGGDPGMWLESFQQRWGLSWQGLLLPLRLREARIRAVDRALEDGLAGQPDEFLSCVEHLAGLCQAISEESLQPGNRLGTTRGAYLELISQILAGTQPDVALDELLQDTHPDPDLEARCVDYLENARPESLLEAAEGLASPPGTGPSWLCPFCRLLLDMTQWRCDCGVVRPF